MREKIKWVKLEKLEIQAELGKNIGKIAITQASV